MSSPPAKKRTSILKKRVSNFESPEATATTTSKLPRRGILFSKKNTVKEFRQCDELTTIWGNSYETSIARSDGSSDSSSTLKKLSFDFSSSNVQAMVNSTTTVEAEKENIVDHHEQNAVKENLSVPSSAPSSVPQAFGAIDPTRITLSPISSSTSNSGFSIDNMTVELNADEKKRIKKYGIDNLNITNMQMDTTLSKKSEDANKPISLMGKSNLEKKDSIESSLSSYTNDISLSIESDEASFVKSDRNIDCSKKPMNVFLGPKRYRTRLRADDNKDQQVFKQPGIPVIPRVFRLSSSTLDVDMNVDSPPIKPLHLPNQKQVLDDYMELMVTETPTKNLCSSMCMTRKHSITPLNMPPPKVLFSSSKTDWKTRTRPNEFLKSLGMDLDPVNDDCEETTHNSVISIEAPAPSKGSARKTLFESEPLSAACTPMETEEKSFFDLEDETVAATKNMTLVKLKDIAAPIQEDVRNTTFSKDISYTESFSERNGEKSGNCSFNRTKANETDTLETTIELATRLLEAPMVTTASTSNLFSRTFQQEASINLDDSLAKTIRDESLNMSVQYHHQISNRQISSSVRGTIYSQNMSLYSDPEEKSQNDAKTEEIVNGPLSINVSGVEPSVEIQGRNRLTVYNNSIEEENHPLPSPKEPTRVKSKDLRRTILDVDTAIVTSPIIDAYQKPNKNRATVYANVSITERNANESNLFLKPIPLPKKPSRGTIFANESMDQTISTPADTSMSMEIQLPKSRLTIFNNDSIIETDNIEPSLIMRESVGTSLHPRVAEKTQMREEEIHGRESIVDESDISERPVSPFIPSQPRLTCYEGQMDETCNNIDVAETRDNFYNHSKMQLDVSQQFVMDGDLRYSVNLSREDIKLLPQKRNAQQRPIESLYVPTEELQEVFEPEMDIAEVTENTEATLRNSVIVKAPAGNVTFYTNDEMEMENPIKQSTVSSTAKNSSIVRVEENKLLNITSAEIVSLIDDETSPSFLEESNRSDIQPLHVSLGSDLSCYQKALQDFVNVTITNSPLNMSLTLNNPSDKSKCTLHEVPARIDYNSKLSELMAGLEKKNDKVKPKLAIDDFLERLNIKQIKIPKLPELEEGYLLNKYRETKEKLNREEEERKASAALQLPKVPDYGFLIENKMKWMGEEIKVELERHRRESLIAMTPAFPELRDFDFLLKNKFETDEQMSKIWKLEMMFAWKRQYKLVHKLLPGYKINITVQSMENLNRSTIPIYFEKVLMYNDPKYRGVKSVRTSLIMNEFRRLIETDLFTSACPSDKELFNFLQLFNVNVKKTVVRVETFLDIISRHDAVLEQHRNGEKLNISHITKRICTTDGSDIVDIMINVQGLIEEISIEDVIVKGLTRYIYKLKPRPNIASTKGLFLIELLLFEPEKFLLENTRRLQTE